MIQFHCSLNLPVPPIPEVPFFSSLLFSLPPPSSQEDTPGEQVELKHSNSGYQWIPPSAEATHSTDFGHTFELRDPAKVVQASVRLDRMPQDL